jgi:signal transduction histidine kinase
MLTEQLAAVSEVLSAVGRHAADPERVLRSLVESARNLCEADACHLFLIKDEHYRLSTTVGLTAESYAYVDQHPIPLDRKSLVGRLAFDRTAQQIADVLSDPDYGAFELQQVAGYRSVMGAPLILDDEVVGALNLWRNDVRPFGERELDLVSGFAGAAALAVNGVRLVRELESASRHKSEFLASMSHELRTPLNAVLGFSELLLERMVGDLNERQEQYLRDINGSGRHLLDLLNDVLDLSKVEAGRMELNLTVLDVRDLIDEAAGMVRERAENAGLTLQVEVTGSLAVKADQLRTRQVLLNLLSNAIKFTPRGGVVTVSAERADTHVLVEVADSGVGIAAEDLERIFESFQQGGRGPSHEEGTGLGLTLSRRLIELHGGQLWVESELGGGSRFRCTLPLHVDVAVSSGRTESRGDARIVLIEDDRLSSELFSTYLRAASVEVLSARDGPSGLAVVREARPDAVILDIRLPGIDGWAVLATLKEDPVTARIPVIIASIVDERPRGASLGAAGYLVKPVGREELLGALAGVGVSVGGTPS